ncbi:phosphatidylinositol glycan anchor biosynthesis class U protein [Centruroides vittatus]|uniref:phosphatidylinositol glycan anchor biosynthesis class U protein n=1 Tax=Centruroides vittatus TaxID=120091 RepID=UPI00350FAA6B
MAALTVGLLMVGACLRLLLINSELRDKLVDRIEISTPLNSWKRAVEGVHLDIQGISPYSGDTFHESPLALMLYKLMIQYVGEYVPLLFVISDVITTVFLMLGSKKYLLHLVKSEGGKNNQYPASVSSLLVSAGKMHKIPYYVAVVYLISPYTVVASVGKSTTVFVNLLISAVFYFTSAGKLYSATIVLAVASYHSFYPVMLIVPMSMYIVQMKYSGNNYKNKKAARIFIQTIVIFTISIAILIIVSYKIMGSWRFLWSTYGCILSVPDLTPNIGLFWYFFTEMFEHFRIFFLWTFQINAFIYTLPLAIRLKKEPMLLFYILLTLMAVFKSYPSISDVGLYLAIMPIWTHLFLHTRQSFLVGCILFSCSVLAPVLWYLWIYAGSANANFYFGISLAFNTGQIFLVTDLLFGYIKREYYLSRGMKTDQRGKPVQLELR